jgi:hypothetical protein
MSSKLLAVRKKGSANRDRKFYGCSFPSDQKCDFFLWAENNVEVINRIISQRTEEQEEEAFKVTALRSYENNFLD